MGTSIINTSWSLQAWLANIEARHPQAIHMGLERVQEVARRMGLIKPDTPVMTVAGTNGKGSTVYLLQQLYLACGYQVGTYTSPHLLHYNERVRINGQSVAEQRLIEAFQAIDAARGELYLSYFEFSTLAALYCFANTALDLIVLEVGMGGRLDATNIIDADLAIITGIDFDHMEWLGDSLEKIAAEKVGILRAGIPLIYGDTVLHHSIQSKVVQCGSRLYQRTIDFDWDAQSSTFHRGAAFRPLAACSDMHPHAIAMSLMALDIFSDRLPISWETVADTLPACQLTGRQQIIRGRLNCLLDVSHNPQSVSSLAEKLDTLKPTGSIRAVFSAVKEKELSAMIRPMTRHVSSWYIAELTTSRKTCMDRLYQAVSSETMNSVNRCDSIQAAFSKACSDSHAGDWIIVYGSFYTVAAVIELNPDITLGEKYEVFNG